MRSITHPDCVAPVVHPTTKRPSIKAAGSSKKTDRTRGAKTEKKREPVPVPLAVAETVISLTSPLGPY